jgi:EpsD family peptidyl-prolyl cis-trans isomerase
MSRYRCANSSRIIIGLRFRPVLIAAALALYACGKTDVKETASQIVARVNGEEISVHQINNVIARSGEFPPEQARQAAAQFLERIIDEELLVQRALKAGLHRDPQVMQAIEGEKRQILARAYLERAVNAGSSDGKEDAGIFYKENPALFERRRIYRVHEVAVLAPQEKLEGLAAAASGGKSLNDVMEWLKSRGLPFQSEISTRPAEQIPMNILTGLFEMREGQINVIPTARGVSVVQLLQSTESPLSAQQAAPVIERYLLGRRRLEMARADMRKLREQAKIEYVGDFAAARPAAAQTTSSRAREGAGFEPGGHIEKGLAELR